MKDYRSLYRFQSLAIAGVIDCVGLFMWWTGQMDLLGGIFLSILTLSFKIRAWFDFKYTDDAAVARTDRDLGRRELFFYVLALTGGTIAFIWYSLTM